VPSSRRWADVGSFHTRLFGVVYVICGDFQGGSEKGAASVHQIVCQSWEKCYLDSHSDSTSLRGPNLELYTGFHWHARFKAGRTSVDDDEHTGRPTSCTTPETVARIQELVRQDRHRTIHDNVGEEGIGYGTCQRVLTKEFGMHHVAGNFVPRILTADQKQQRVDVCHSVFMAKHKMTVIPTQRTPLIWYPVPSSYIQN
jgi:hypothetical protein